METLIDGQKGKYEDKVTNDKQWSLKPEGGMGYYRVGQHQDYREFT
jgi:hypothetical protein